ncbi:MAG: hypothetical protein WCN95_08380 [bacterium]
MKTRYFLTLLFLTVLVGCSISAPNTEKPKSKHEDDARLIKTVGLLPKIENQHPLVVGKTVKEGFQGYLDLVEDGKRTKQVIVVYPTNMKRPEDKDRLIEIRGQLHLFKASNPTNVLHKKAFDCEVIEVLEWEYRK